MSLFEKPESSKPSEAKAPGTATSPPTTGSSSPSAPSIPNVKNIQRGRSVGYLKGRPGFRRNLWTRHPNRTTRKLRKLLVSWENLGYYLGFASASPSQSPGTERAFLRSKVAIAHSAGFLRSIRGAGNVGREAYEMEGEFMKILEQCPSLSVVTRASADAKRELFYSWHTLYLFLHRVLGAYPYEAAAAQTAPLSIVAPGKVEGAAKRLGPLGERKMA
ncbi:MAG: hypothetical protein JSW03_01200 [Candidatus Eiseniibacteriota bacterium]|nr:MAG: hypothetical protein JSW03_01200 [Candidatus Eisenbacteria bacterium]